VASAARLRLPIDFLTAGDPRFAVPIAGQPGLLAQGYPGQNVLLQNTRSMHVGKEVHALLDPPPSPAPQYSRSSPDSAVGVGNLKRSLGGEFHTITDNIG
jgi:hypothetical protein